MSKSSPWTWSKVTLLTGAVVLSFYYSTISWRRVDSDESTRVIVAGAILFAMYALMVFELVNRNLAALIGAAVSVAAYDCLVDYVKMEQILEWEDLETLSLLFGMMIIVNVLALSGLFDYLAIWAYKRAAGHFWWLITIMSLITAVLSAFIDNVSSMLLMAPTLIKLAELEDLDPRPILIIMVLFCNIGGCATPVGDPPNLIIIGDPVTQELGIGFGSFTAYCAPCVLVTMATILVYLKLRYKSKESFISENTTGNRDSVEHSAQIMQLAIDLSGLDAVAAGPKGEPVRSNSVLSEVITTTNAIKNKSILIKSLVVLVATILLFFSQSLPGTNLTLGWISLFAGLTLLVLCSGTKVRPLREIDACDVDDDGEEEEEEKDVFEHVVSNIEWSTLMFFFSLFIVMEVMEKLGLIGFIGQQISNSINQLPAGRIRDIGALTIILWSAGIASACIDNVPFTSMMIKVLATMLDTVQAEQKLVVAGSWSSPSLNIRSLIIALAFGACYGGNGTIIGASANLVTAGVAGRSGYPIHFNGFLRYATVPTLISLVVANIYLVVVFVFLDL